MDRLLTVNQGKNGQKHKKSSTDVVLWKIQFCEKCIKSLIIVWRKSLVNWNEVSRGFCVCFLPTSPRKKCSKQLERIRTRHFKRSNIPFHYPLGNIIWHGAGAETRLHCGPITQPLVAAWYLHSPVSTRAENKPSRRFTITEYWSISVFRIQVSVLHCENFANVHFQL